MDADEQRSCGREPGTEVCEAASQTRWCAVLLCGRQPRVRAVADRVQARLGRPEWEWPKGIGKLKTISQIFKEQGGYELEGSVLGKELVGLEYSGPFDHLPAQQQEGGYPSGIMRGAAAKQSAVQCHRVIDGGRDSKGNPNVVAGEGTGIVHIAPGCGDVDYHLGQAQGIVPIAPLGPDGRFLSGFDDFTGLKATDKSTAEKVFEHLKANHFLVAIEDYPHIYPHCWRTGDELVFRLVDEWFIDMDWREEIKEVVKQIRWLPSNMDGQQRELDWLTNMSDWMISKKRFWGLALPICLKSTKRTASLVMTSKFLVRWQS